MTVAPDPFHVSRTKVEPGTTPEQTVARFMAAFWGKTFLEEVTEENFIAQATRIVREIRPEIVREAFSEIRTLLLEAIDKDVLEDSGEEQSVIKSVYQMAGQARGCGSTQTEALMGSVADLLARIWVKVNDGTLAPPNWVEIREREWINYHP